MNKTLATLVGTTVVFTGFLTFSPSQAQAAACQTGGISGGFGLTSLSPICYGVIIDNNESASDLNNGIAGDPGSFNPIPTTGAWGYKDWKFLAKVNTPGGPEGQPTLLINNSTNPLGTLLGEWSYNSFDIGKQYALVVKGGTSWSTYGFTAINTSSSGTWSNTLAGLVNKGGEVPVLSHFSIYERGTGTPVPEPLTLLGSGLAFGFGAHIKRKLNRKQKKA